MTTDDFERMTMEVTGVLKCMAWQCCYDGARFGATVVVAHGWMYGDVAHAVQARIRADIPPGHAYDIDFKEEILP